MLTFLHFSGAIILNKIMCNSLVKFKKNNIVFAGKNQNFEISILK